MPSLRTQATVEGDDLVYEVDDARIVVAGGKALLDDEFDADGAPSDDLVSRIDAAVESALDGSGWAPRFKLMDAATLAADERARHSVEIEYAVADEMALCNFDIECDLSRDVVEGWLDHADNKYQSFEGYSHVDCQLNSLMLDAALEEWPKEQHGA